MGRTCAGGQSARGVRRPSAAAAARQGCSLRSAARLGRVPMPDVFALRPPWRGAGRSPLSEWPLVCRRSAAACSRSRRLVFSATRTAGAGVTRVGREGAAEGADLTGGGAGRSRAAGLMAMPASASNPGGANVFTSRPGGFRRIRRQGHRLEHPREFLGARMRVSARRQAHPFGDGLGNRLAMRLARASYVRRAAAQRRDLRTSERGAAPGEAIVDRPRVPVHLVHGPRHERRLLQRLDPLGLRAA